MTDIFLKVVNMSISAGWLILAVVLLRLLLKKAPRWAMLLLWAIVAVRLVCPFSLESALSLIPSGETIAPEIMMAREPRLDTGIPAWNAVVNPVIAASFTPDPAASANPLQIWIPLWSWIWLAGIAVLLAYTAVSYWRLCRRVATAVRLSGDIFRSEFVATPFVLGVFRPRIYLPGSLSDEDYPYVLAHERTHIHRRDHWWKPLGFLVLMVHWFNPLVWLGYILFCRDMELACDERVIRDFGRERRADYAQALLSCSVHRSRLAACPVAFGEVGIKTRIRAVAKYKKPALWVVVIAVILSGAVAVCFLTDPEQQELPQPAVEATQKATAEPSTEPPLETTQPPEDPAWLTLADLGWFLELAASDSDFREMSDSRRNDLVNEYGDLLDDYALLARETGDGKLAYIIGAFRGDNGANPFRELLDTHHGGSAGDLQVLYREEDFEAVETALRLDRVPEAGYVIRESVLAYSRDQGLILIQPRGNTRWLSDVFHKYLRPNGPAYLQDAADRGIALMTPAMPYLSVHLISEQWGEMTEDIPLTQEQLDTILAQPPVKLDKGHGFAATLYGMDEVLYFTESKGVPQLVLELAIEKCGYKFASPADITGTVTEARLECNWLEKPAIYAGEEDLARLTRILQNAEFGFVGACGYGARLTVQLADGRELVMFKGTDSCDSFVFGSWGGYFLGDAANLEFWQIFGLDPDSKQPIS